MPDEFDLLHSETNNYNLQGEIIEIKKTVKEALEQLINLTEIADIETLADTRYYLNPVIEKLQSIENYEHKGVQV